MFTATKTAYSNAFLGEDPLTFGFLTLVEDKPVGFYIYCFKFASYLGSKVLYIGDIYLTKSYRTLQNKKELLKHAIQQSIIDQCVRVEMRVLKSFNLGYDIIKECGFSQIDKWDVFRYEQDDM